MGEDESQQPPVPKQVLSEEGGEQVGEGERGGEEGGELGVGGRPG